MYKEIKENLINISSSILSVQNKMVNVYYKGNMNLKIKRFRRNIQFCRRSLPKQNMIENN